MLFLSTIKEYKEWTIIGIGDPKTNDLPISELSELQTRPLDLIQFYKDFGRGILCGLFFFGTDNQFEKLKMVFDAKFYYPEDRKRLLSTLNDLSKGTLYVDGL